MNNYFEGNYRRTPEQNLSGSGRRKVNVNNLLSRAQDERRRRERERWILEKTVRLQSIYRGHRCRKFWHAIFKAEFEEKMNELDPTKPLSMSDLCFLLKRLNLVFPKNYEFNSKRINIGSQKKNVNYIIAVAKLMQKIRVTVIAAMGKDRHWIYRIIAFLRMNNRLLKYLPSDVEELAVPVILQNIICFTDVPLYKQMFSGSKGRILPRMIWQQLRITDIFVNLVKVLSLQSKFTPTTYKIVLSAVLLLFKNSFDLFQQLQDRFFNMLLASSFTFAVLHADMELTVRKQLLPNLINMENFPLMEIGRNIKDDLHMTANCLHRFVSADREMTAVPAQDLREYIDILCEILHPLHQLKADESRLFPYNSGRKTFDTISAEKHQMLQATYYDLLHSELRTDTWLNYLKSILSMDENKNEFQKFIYLLYLLWLPEQPSVFESRLFNEILVLPGFLERLWTTVNVELGDMYFQILYEKVTRLGPLYIQTTIEQYKDLMIPILTMFCYFFLNHIIILQEERFYKEDQQDGTEYKPFDINKIREITVYLRTAALEVKTLAYVPANIEETFIENVPRPLTPSYNYLAWRTLFKMLHHVLQFLYNRDCRRKFMEDAFWYVTTPAFDLHKGDDRELLRLLPFSSKMMGFEANLTYDDQNMITIYCFPFLLDLRTRMTMYRHFVNEMKEEFQDPDVHFLQTPHILIQIRRQYLYEDAFHKLNHDTAPEVRIHVRIHMINSLGLEEAGIDGGGLFREFIIELLKTAFDPNRGFFLCNSDNELYPNPNVHLIEPEFEKHYAFIGRMLGKAIYEKVLVEAPLAEFFLSRIVEDQCELPINDLASLDPDMHRHLLSLLSYEGSFADLGLDFTLSVDCFGSNKIVYLKPDGSNIPVTEKNVLEYVNLVSYFKIYQQLSVHMDAFIYGLRSIIPSSWITMFTAREFQLIISGTESPFDVSDLRKCAIYTGQYNDEHPTIQMFWRVFSNFTRVQKCQLLKFVTSCSRPPLLGFKELVPPFCIQYVADIEMLPTSSTCTNVLKLPNFQDENTMREKLLYAINSASGFELM